MHQSNATALPSHVVMEQVTRICRSPALVRSPAQQHLLRFLVEETIQGRSENLSRLYVYQQRFSAVSQEETISKYRRHLETNLEKYYATASEADRIRITLRSGSFVPSIEWIPPAAPIVDRANDVQRFHQFWQSRNGSICLVAIAGEPGIGKTTLGHLLLNGLRASGQIRTIATAHGPDDSRSGAPYLPFQDVLTRLLGQLPMGAQKTLRHSAPSWARALRVGMSGDAGPGMPLPSELGEFLLLSARNGGLGLFLDDAHLSDYSTARIVSQLARTGSGRIAIVLAYRDAEARAVSHPIIEAVARLESSGCCCSIAPARLDITSTRHYIDQRFRGHLLPPRLAIEIHERTRGLPLHLVDLARHLVERGDVAVANHRWTLTRPIDAVVSAMPETADQLVDSTLGSLDGKDLRLLSAGALIGEEFSTGIVAAMLNAPADEVERGLHGISTKGTLLCFAGSSSHKDPQSVASYRFTHATYRRAVLNRLAAIPAQRRVWAARAVEFLQPRQMQITPESQARLAGLCEASGRIREALEHYLDSASLASKQCAFGTVASLCRRGLELIQSASQCIDERSRSILEIRLESLLGVAAISTSDFTEPECEPRFSRVLQAARLAGDVKGQITGLFGLWVCRVTSGQLRASLRAAEELREITAANAQFGMEIESLYAIGTSLIQLGHIVEAREMLVQALQQADKIKRADHEWFFPQDARVLIRCQLARSTWFLGEIDPACAMVEEALRIAERGKSPEDRVYALVFLADLACLNWRAEDALHWSEKAIAASLDCGASQEYAWASMAHACALSECGEVRQALDEFAQALAFYSGHGGKVALTKFKCIFAETLIKAGEPQEALKVIESAFATMRETEETYFEAELLRIRAEALVLLDPAGHRDAIEQSLREALRIADEKSLRSLHLRAALSLFRHARVIGFTRSEMFPLLRESYAVLDRGGCSVELKQAERIIRRSAETAAKWDVGDRVPTTTR